LHRVESGKGRLEPVDEAAAKMLSSRHEARNVPIPVTKESLQTNLILEALEDYGESSLGQLAAKFDPVQLDWGALAAIVDKLVRKGTVIKRGDDGRASYRLSIERF
jgi:hypothetical protein